MNLLWLAFGWIAYAALHSALASDAVKRRVALHWPGLMPRYRLFYNVVAIVTALPLAALIHAANGPLLWRWEGLSAWGANALALAALAGVFIASRGYDMDEFLGLRPPAATPPRLVISPLHRHVRHPWYSCALLIVWTRDMDAAWLLSAVMITGYFIIGSRCEETRLIAMFGERYRRYMARVPGLLPWPGRCLDAAEARRLADS
jgi:protein-S-isoprenylcysteine O-methyltransferase Ste14